jgi:hypothetical protein
MGFLALQNKKDATQEELREFHLAVNQAQFLFPSYVSNKILEASQSLERMRIILFRWDSEDKKPNPSTEKLGRLAEEKHELSQTVDALIDEFPRLFNTLLYFGDIEQPKKLTFDNYKQQIFGVSLAAVSAAFLIRTLLSYSYGYNEVLLIALLMITSIGYAIGNIETAFAFALISIGLIILTNIAVA